MGKSGQQDLPPPDRGAEASNLVRLVSDPAFALDKNIRFLEVNEAFADLTGMRLLTLQGQGLDTLSDQALRLQLEDLVQKARSPMGSITQGQLEISGNPYDIYIMASPDSINPTDLSYIIGTIRKRSVT